MIDYAGNEINHNGDCDACSYASHEFSLPCGAIYEDEICTVSQDWSLPIPNFIVVAPKRHLELLTDLTNEENEHIFGIVNKVILIMREKIGVNRINCLYKELENRHFHIWIWSRDGWKERGINPILDMRELMDYAKNNMRQDENFKEIERTVEIMRRELS
jgi:diadenosine tetraphosphate (Ap4A) HIT family hydrolase